MLANEELRVVNRTGTRLYYQVTASHPDCYDIRPRQDILEVNAVTNIAFRLNKKKIIEQGDPSAPPFDRLRAFLKDNAV
jgi:hypothetical protein